MINHIDHTHSPELGSWVPGANGHPTFPIQNLPLCVFSTEGRGPRGGVVIGNHVVDLIALAATDLVSKEHRALIEVASAPDLKGFFALSPPARRRFRQLLSGMLAARTDASEALSDTLLVPQNQAAFHLPTQVRSFTDFSNSVAHVLNVGRILNPAAPIFPSFKYLPVGFGGRGSSIRVSGHPVLRPQGQLAPFGARKPEQFGPTQELDFELELAFWIGSGNRLGEPIPISTAGEHIAGFGLLNDWTARDMQFWESLPLGPFLSKNFLTTVSPFVVTAEALAPFHCAPTARQTDDPEPFPYLLDRDDQANGALDIRVEVFLTSRRMREQRIAPVRLVRSSTTHLYWTPAQLVAHHTSNGSCIEPGDLFGSGTVSSLDEDGKGCLLEITEVGRRSLTLPSGEKRTYLEDGDEVVLDAYCERRGCARIGFGQAVGQVVAAGATGADFDDAAPHLRGRPVR